MKILLINTALRPNSIVKMFPCGIGYIASAIKNAGYNLSILDIEANRPSQEGIEYALQKEKYDVVALSSIASGYKMVKELCQTIRNYQPQAIIIAGNTVASSIPIILLRFTEVNVAVIGEGDDTIVDLLNQIKIDPKGLYNVRGIYYKLGNDKITKTFDRPPIASLDDLPWINFDLLDVETYIQNGGEQVSRPLPGGLHKDDILMLPINTARGCLYNCTFCYHAFKGVKYRTRSAKSVLNEAQHLVDKYNVNYIGFSDELTFYMRDQTDRFVTAMEEKWPNGTPFFWMANARGDLLKEDKDINLVKRMKNAGCHGFFFSLESANKNILKTMNKHLTKEQFIFQTELVKRAGLPVWTSIVLGYPEENFNTIKETFGVCSSLGIYPSIGFVSPQPGSSFYEYAKEYKYITDEESYLLSMTDRQDLQINFTTMPDDEFLSCVKEEAIKCKNACGIELDESKLFKTQYYQESKK